MAKNRNYFLWSFSGIFGSLHDDADRNGQQRTCRCCQAHRKKCCWEDLRGQIDTRDTHQRNFKNVMQERQPGFSASIEISAETEMDTRKNAVPDISSQVLPVQPYHIRTTFGVSVRKQRYDGFRRKLNDDGGNHTEANSKQDRIPQCLNCPFRLLSTDILCAQRRNRRKHRGRDQEQKAHYFFNNTNCRRIVQAPVIGNDGNDDKSNLNQVILQGNGNTDFQNLPHYRAVGLEVGFLRNDTLSLQNHSQGHNYADRLGYRCTQRCSGRTEAEHTYKKIVQADVGSTGYGDKVHRTFAVTHTAENGADNVIRRDKGNAALSFSYSAFSK